MAKTQKRKLKKKIKPIKVKMYDKKFDVTIFLNKKSFKTRI